MAVMGTPHGSIHSVVLLIVRWAAPGYTESDDRVEHGELRVDRPRAVVDRAGCCCLGSQARPLRTPSGRRS